jgi:predicted RNase H-like nuclease (RuvC/YqgF family)
MLRECKAACRWARFREVENKELRSALRAEKAHVEQLQRKLVLLQDLMPSVREGC